MAKKASNTDFDVIIVGGGPGGTSSATYLSKKGYNALLVDKAKWPRDKTCGDGISGKSAKILDELGITDKVEKAPHSEMNGVLFSSPDGTILDVEMPEGGRDPAGYVCRREVFDNVLFEHASKQKNVTVMEEFTFNKLLKDDQGQVIGINGKSKSGEEHDFYANVVIGADGALSPIASQLGYRDSDPKHNLVAIRTYYEGVKGNTDKIELHFVDEALPGYFWIFPLENGLSNVGMGMVIDDYQKKYKGKRLDEIMFKIIENHPVFKERFKGAKMVSPIKGWNLPVGSKLRPNVADGCVLVGDACALIDPLSGEGIGNALISGKMAAEQIDECFKKNDFSKKALMPYQERVHRELGSEMKVSYQVQKLGRHKWLLNAIIGKAARKPELKEVVSMSLLKPDAKEVFTSPWFLIKNILF